MGEAKLRDELKKRLYTLVLCTIDFLDELPKELVSKRIADQLLRSSTSVLANFVEARAASTTKDFTKISKIFAASVLTLKSGKK